MALLLAPVSLRPASYNGVFISHLRSLSPPPPPPPPSFFAPGSVSFPHFYPESAFLIVPSPFYVYFYFRFVSPFFLFSFNSLLISPSSSFFFLPCFPCRLPCLRLPPVFTSQFTSVQHRVPLFSPPSEFNFIFCFIVLVFYSFSFGC